MSAKRRRPARKGGGEALHQRKTVMLQVAVWEAAVDPEELNAEILRLIRRDDERQNLTETDLARRSGMTRQHVHNLHHEDMHLTLPMMTKWCNGRHVGIEFLITYAAQRVRCRHARPK